MRVLLPEPQLPAAATALRAAATGAADEYPDRIGRPPAGSGSPQRGRLLAAKTVVLAAITWGYGAAVAATCWLLAGLILPDGFGGPGVGTAARLVAATATWLAIVALFTCGLGTALRSTPGRSRPASG